MGIEVVVLLLVPLVGEGWSLSAVSLSRQPHDILDFVYCSGSRD